MTILPIWTLVNVSPYNLVFLSFLSAFLSARFLLLRASYMRLIVLCGLLMEILAAIMCYQLPGADYCIFSIMFKQTREVLILGT